MSVIQSINRYADRIAGDFVWANTFGLGRALLATGLLITLCFNDIHRLVHPIITDLGGSSVDRLFFLKFSLYRLFPEQLELIKAFSIVVLSLVIIGWRPRITGVLHWWVTFSFASSALVVDGGDQIAQVLSLLLIPLCLADGRRSHWVTVDPKVQNFEWNLGQKMANILAASTLLIIQLQVAFIYFHACVGKFKVEEWVNGTALFYWLQNPIFGANEFLQPILLKLFSNPYIISFTTWGVLLFELCLFLGLVLAPKYQRLLLKAGFVFHFSIIFLHGLVSFFFTMAAALTLYLGPRQGFQWNSWKNKRAKSSRKIHSLQGKTAA